MPEYEAYIRSWQRRWKREKEADAAAAERALAIARRLARILVREYGATRVVLCGSLARGDFQQGSDIDLAVEGIPDDRFFAAGAHVAREAGEFEVDVVPLEAATEGYRRRLAEEGIPLHDTSGA
jgi:predicted nucleotidyltransferase